MAQIHKLEITTVTGGAGAGTATINVPSSFIYKAEWDKGNLADTTTVTLKNTGTKNGTDVTLLSLGTANNADAMLYLRVVEHNTGGTALATVTPPMVSGNVQLVIAAGGTATTGAMYLHCIAA
jgi:hypothetical protein